MNIIIVILSLGLQTASVSQPSTLVRMANYPLVSSSNQGGYQSEAVQPMSRTEGESTGFKPTFHIYRMVTEGKSEAIRPILLESSSEPNKKQWKRWLLPVAITVGAGTTLYLFYGLRGR